MNNLTAAQLKVIQTWTEQRDLLLREIGQYTTELEALQKSGKEAGLNLADIHNGIAEARGRIAELAALEERVRGSVPNDIAELEVRKSRLQSECAALDERMRAGSEKYVIVMTAVSELQSAHDIMKDQAAIVNRVVGEIIQTSQLHTSDMKTIMSEIKTISDQVIEKGNANIAQAGIILEKLPKYIFELQRPIPVRRVYASPKGTFIHPDPIEE